jgi:hypothetical protein
MILEVYCAVTFFIDYLTHDFEMFRESLILPTKYDAAIPAESYVPFNCFINLQDLAEYLTP